MKRTGWQPGDEVTIKTPRDMFWRIDPYWQRNGWELIRLRNRWWTFPATVKATYRLREATISATLVASSQT